VQFESRLSLTGAKADRRYRVAPRELGPLMTHLSALVAEHAGAAFDANDLPDSPVPVAELQKLADRLWQQRGRSLVVCGSEDVATQILCNFLNHTLGAYGATLELTAPSRQRQADDDAVRALAQELADGKVAALFIHDANPVYDLPDGQGLAQAIQKTPLVVNLAQRLDETARLSKFVCPDHHYLESWGDSEAVRGVVSFRQPTVAPLGDTRSILESLSAWTGAPRSALDILRETWPDQSNWERSIHDGYAAVSRQPTAVQSFQTAATQPVRNAPGKATAAFELVLYAKVAMLDGRQAYNPWLHELPDPISKAVWDNYACLSPAAAARLGLSQGDVLRVEMTGPNAAAKSIELPVLIQPGQHDRVVAVALGYGSELSRRFADIGPAWLHDRPSVGDNGLVGTNAAPLLNYQNGKLRLSGAQVKVSPTGRKHVLALTQEHHTITVPEHLAPAGAARRPHIHETTLAALQAPASSQPQGHEQTEDLWPRDHQYPGRHWGMAIDLTACTGCAACVIACQVENNIPVVGKDEVRRNREMHWVRIDRYYSEHDGEIDVAHQPMMCHHCDQAPCETVCPVLATVHGSEGLNQQAYNRCVGTRYCANNCPYKVRRFNWFNYPRNDVLQNMTLNPDVTIRSRGIMEKCSFCVQRIQEAKIEAKRRGVELADGDVQPACQQSCPAGAIVFGDTNDPESRVAKLIESGRHFRVLEEINVRPSLGYLKLVRNRPDAEGRQTHG
jgi:molybdopterin-containing oxidoreductase family iron-sulfur binding subunit